MPMCHLCGDDCAPESVDVLDLPRERAVTVCDGCIHELSAWADAAGDEDPFVWLPWEFDFDPDLHGLIAAERPLPHREVA